MGEFFGRVGQLASRLKERRKRPAPAKPQTAASRYGTAGSEPIASPPGMVGREAEGAQLVKALKKHRVVLVHGAARIGKTCLAQACAQAQQEKAKPFWYTCPADRGIGELYERLGRFLGANRQEQAGREVIQPEANDDDRTGIVAEALGKDAFLVVLDQFDAVAHREPFRALVRAVAAGEGSGRLLVVGRQPPEWWTTLPTARVATVEVPPLCPADVGALAARLGFSAHDLAALEQCGAVHPFALQLVLHLARLRQVSPATILASVSPDRLEFAILSVLYRSLAERDVLDRLSVLREAFTADAANAFGGPAGWLAREDVALLLETTKDGRIQLHPVVGEFATSQVRGRPELLAPAHEQAVAYYRAELGAGGRWHKRVCCELAHHLLALGRPAEALRVLAAEARGIVSFGLGWRLLCLLGKVEEGMEHFGAALAHFSLEAHPREYGGTQQDMGDAHRLLLTGRRSFRLRQAMTYYTEAARVHEQEIFPEDFAGTQLSLAIAHRQLAIHEGPEPHHGLSVKCYENALRVYTAEGFPSYHKMIVEILAKEEGGGGQQAGADDAAEDGGQGQAGDAVDHGVSDN